MESGIWSPYSGNGIEIETETVTGSRTRIIKIEDVLMVLPTIIRCSTNWTLYMSLLLSLVPFHEREIEHTWSPFMKNYE